MGVVGSACSLTPQRRLLRRRHCPHGDRCDDDSRFVTTSVAIYLWVHVVVWIQTQQRPQQYRYPPLLVFGWNNYQYQYHRLQYSRFSRTNLKVSSLSMLFNPISVLSFQTATSTITKYRTNTNALSTTFITTRTTTVSTAMDAADVSATISAAISVLDDSWTSGSQPNNTSVPKQQVIHEKKTWMFRDKHPIYYERYCLPIQSNRNVDNTCTDAETAATTTTTTTTTTNTNILLLNGFGMGTFHQQRFIHEMIRQRQQHEHNQSSSSSSTATTNNNTDTNSQMILYSIDYLGQGKSWPIQCDDGNSVAEDQLQYSAQTWMEQIVQFIQQVILVDDTTTTTTATNSDSKEDTAAFTSHDESAKTKMKQSHNNGPPHQQQRVHLVGNSVGGYLATYVAATHPKFIASLVLLNATPIWGLNLPGWSGHLPAPNLPKRIGRYLFDQMRSTTIIQQFLKATYCHDPLLYHPQLIQEIQQCTNDPGGHAAFASILWSPPLTVPAASTTSKNDTSTGITASNHHDPINFYDCLQQLVQCPVLLCYGQNDPWCQPILAQQMLHRLRLRRPPQQEQQVSTSIQHHVELSNVGHCPHHEAPVATSTIVRKWIQYLMMISPSTSTTPNITNSFWSEPMVIDESWGNTTVYDRSNDKMTRSWMDRLMSAIV
jgi:pimeloyl-ACP methyl ester carboxylesterase